MTVDSCELTAEAICHPGKDYNDANQLFAAIAAAPLDYLANTNSKHFRDHLIEALNVWYKLPQEEVSKIKSIIQMLHQSSLM